MIVKHLVIYKDIKKMFFFEKPLMARLKEL